MIMHIINYGIRGLIILLGILLLSGYFASPKWDVSFLRIMGIVFILFGIYRIVIYYTQSKKYNFYKENEDEDDV